MRQEHQEEETPTTTTPKAAEPVYSKDLVDSMKIIKTYPDKTLPSQRYWLWSLPIPTMSEIFFDYNPGYLIPLKCAVTSLRFWIWSVTKVQSAVGVELDWHKMLHMVEDVGGKMAHLLGPKVFGMQATKVSFSDCACDDTKAIQEQTKFSCEFHITRDDADDHEEVPDDDDELDTSTLMSVHLDTFLDQRYEWYSKTLPQLPRVLQRLVLCLMELLNVPFSTLMSLSQQADFRVWLREIVKHPAA